MRYLLLGLVAYLLMVLEGALLQMLALSTVAPDLSLVLVTAVALSRRGRILAHGLFALALGYLADVLSGAPTGLYAATHVAVALGARLFVRRLYVEGLLADTLAGLAASAAGGLLAALLAAAAGVPVAPSGRLLLAQALATAACAPPLFALVRRTDRRLGLEHRPLRVP